VRRLKIVKSLINTCTTVRNDDVIVTSFKNAVFARRKSIQNSFRLYCGLQIRRISIQLTSVWGHTAREGVQRTRDQSRRPEAPHKNWVG